MRILQTPVYTGAGKNGPIISGNFFMLFMAVTLGFFVENQREHYVEYIREKQYRSAAGKDENVIKAYRYTYPALNNITFAF
jgi:hypothetical protein